MVEGGLLMGFFIEVKREIVGNIVEQSTSPTGYAAVYYDYHQPVFFMVTLILSTSVSSQTAASRSIC